MRFKFIRWIKSYIKSFKKINPSKLSNVELLLKLAAASKRERNIARKEFVKRVGEPILEVIKKSNNEDFNLLIKELKKDLNY